MRVTTLFLVVNSLWATLALADNQKLPSFPVLGYVDRNLLYVPTYRTEHQKIPERLFAYGGGQEFIATLRKNDSFIVSDKRHDCYDSSIGHFIYDTQSTAETVSVVIFDERKNIQSKEGKLTESVSNTMWEIFDLTSHEGGYEILRTSRNEECISHVDYYTYCAYDTKADSEKAFQSAQCGKKINYSDTGF